MTLNGRSFTPAPVARPQTTAPAFTEARVPPLVLAGRDDRREGSGHDPPIEPERDGTAWSGIERYDRTPSLNRRVAHIAAGVTRRRDRSNKENEC